MIKIGISMIKNWYSNYFYFNDQHFKKPMVPFVSWSLLSLGPFWPWSLLAMVPFGSWSLLAGPFWPVPFGQSLLAWSLLTSNVPQGLVTFGHGFIFWKVTYSCRMLGTSILQGLATFGHAFNGLVTFGHGLIFWKVTNSCGMLVPSILHGLVTFRN